MSKLEELIARLCPDGVEYKELGEVCYIQSGWGFPNKEQGCLEGDYPFFKVSDMNLLGNEICMLKANNCISTDTAKRLKCKPTPEGTIIFPKIGAAIGTNKKRITTGDSCYDNNIVGLISKEAIIYKYLYYVFDKVDLTSFADYSGAMPSIRKSTLEKFKVPVPPLEVQREIVHILDSYTASNKELKEQLDKELAARQKQYEWYRNNLFIRITEVEMVELGDVCSFVRGPFGGALKKEIFQPNGYAVYEQQHAIYKNLDIRYFIDSKKYEDLKRFRVNAGDIIVSCSGTIGKTFVIPDNAPEGVINQALLKLTPCERLNVYYLQYFFENSIINTLNDVSRGGAIKNVPSVSDLKKIKIPLPSLEIQQSIVDILDRFDALCNDITSGLPAEIEARQKQYEYYRDKLLTFKELKKEA